MLQVTSSLSIDASEIAYDFIRAAGPGGQNVNKVATAVQLRFDLRRSASLTPETKARLASLAGRRLSKDGILVIEAKRYRTQEQNRLDATERLIGLIRKALAQPKPRQATRPGRAAKARRIEAKMRHARIKKIRGTKPTINDA
ncbi:MAG: alternative ribosome rescue aminoacyl-tRNA hydrolase ArfB [Anaerolineales bacterium]|jgi:ribosome-associated protein